MEDFSAPTPAGEEPKLVKVAKNITWGAVLILVLIELFVSVKVGGMPFDTSKSTGIGLPLPDFKEMLKSTK